MHVCGVHIRKFKECFQTGLLKTLKSTVEKLVFGKNASNVAKYITVKKNEVTLTIFVGYLSCTRVVLLSEVSEMLLK